MEFATRVLTVFISTALGLWVARHLYRRLELLATPLSKRLDLPVGLVALSIAEARAPHAILARWMAEGAVTFRHVLTFSFVTWPLRTVLLHLRLGIIPLAVGALGPLGLAYLSIVYLPSVVGFAIATRMGRGLQWPRNVDTAKLATSVNILKTAAEIAGRYAIFEVVFLLLDLWGVRISLDFAPLTPEAIAVASIAAVRPSLGIMAAAPLYFGGRMAAAEVLLALLLGRLVYMSVFEFPRSAVQFYGSIYPPAAASRLVVYTALVMYGVTLPILAALWLVSMYGKPPEAQLLSTLS